MTDWAALAEFDPRAVLLSDGREPPRLPVRPDGPGAWAHLQRFAARVRGNFMAGRTWAMQEGLKDLDRAAALDPANPHVFAWRSRVYKGLDLLEEAHADADRAVALAPGYLWARLARANIRAELGRSEDALSDCGWVLERAPRQAWAWAMQARVKARAAGARACVEDLDRAIALDPALGALYAWRGEAKRQTGDAAGAEADLLKSLETPETSPLAPLWLGRLRMEQERWEEALALVDRAIAAMPEYNLARMYRWQLRLRLGRFAEAVEDFDAFQPMQAEPPAPDVWRGRSAWELAWKGKLDGDAAALEEAVRLEPEHARALFWRAELAYRERGASAAEPWLERALSVEAAPQALALRGRLKLDGGEPVSALHDLDAALYGAPDGNAARAWRGEALVQLGRLDDALEELTAVRCRILGSPEPLRWRAEALRRKLAK